MKAPEKRKQIARRGNLERRSRRQVLALGKKFLASFLQGLPRTEVPKRVAAPSDGDLLLELSYLAIAEGWAKSEKTKRVEELALGKVQGLSEDEFRRQLSDKNPTGTKSHQASSKPDHRSARWREVAARHLLRHPELVAKASRDELLALADYLAAQRWKPLYHRDRDMYRALKNGAKRCEYELAQLRLGMVQIAQEALKGPLEKLRDSLPPEFPGSRKK